MPRRSDSPNRDLAMRKAYAFAKSGNRTWAYLWVQRAASFAYVGPHRLGRVNRLLLEAEAKKQGA